MWADDDGDLALFPIMGNAEEEAATTQRNYCAACERPASVCICRYLPSPPVASAIHTVILMHPKESERACCTAPLVARSLENCDLLLGRELGDFKGKCAILDAAIASPEATAVLFPGPDAFDLSDVGGGDDAMGPPLPRVRYLIVFDGTWRYAREMFERNRRHLQGATQVFFSKPFGRGNGGRSE